MAEITKRTLELTKANKSLKNEIRDLKRELALERDKVTALQTEYDIQGELIKKIKRGGMFYYTSNGFVYNINIVEGYFETTFLQEEIDGIGIETILKSMQTSVYKKVPFVYEEKGTFKIDREQYKKFKGAILL